MSVLSKQDLGTVGRWLLGKVLGLAVLRVAECHSQASWVLAQGSAEGDETAWDRAGSRLSQELETGSDAVDVLCFAEGLLGGRCGAPASPLPHPWLV